MVVCIVVNSDKQTLVSCSSIGMAKAALEATNGTNLFGDIGSNWSVVFTDIDAHYRNRTNFDSLLPRESASKVTIACFQLVQEVAGCYGSGAIYFPVMTYFCVQLVLPVKY